jgi:acetylornithine deacetylase
MGRVLTSLETLDRALQAASPHPLLGTASLHASLIEGGRELSSYPDSCVLKIERRTLPGETDAVVARELETLFASLRAVDPEFEASATPLFSRPAYEIAANHELPRMLGDARGSRKTGCVGMSFWTDAAVLGGAGIPSVLFGPGGAGLHSTEEYVNVEDVIACRDVLVAMARAWTAR